MNLDFGAASSTLVMTLTILAVVLAVVLILRMIVLWYFRLDHIAERLSLLNGKQLQANELLEEIASQLAARNRSDLPVVSPPPVAVSDPPNDDAQRSAARNPLTSR